MHFSIFSDASGRVLVYDMYTGMTGTVCSKYWDDVHATVMCRHSGHYYYYDNGTAITVPKNETVPRMVYGVHCQGWELSLTECKLNIYYGTECDTMDDAAYVCGNIGKD